MRALVPCGLTLSGLLLCVPAALPAQQPETDFHLAGGNYAVYNLAGSLTVERASGNQLAVHVSRQGADGAALRVSTGDVRGRSALRVIYPDADVVYSGMGEHDETELQVRDDGTFDDGVGHGRRVRIHGAGRGTRASADLRIGLPAGASLQVHLAAGQVMVQNVEGNISVDVGAAGVTVDGLTGDFSLDAGSGPVSLARIRGKRISLDTGSGEIEAADIAATQLTLDSGSGNVTLDGLAADDVDLDTGSGAISVTLDTDVESLNLDSGSGSVTIRAPSDLGAHLTVDGGSGRVDVRLPLADRRGEDGDLSGTLGDGKGQITIDAGSGDVSILPR